MAEEEKKDSIYDSDRVETSIDTEPDLFDDVFGTDDEKKAARKRLQEKAKELAEKNKKKQDKAGSDENDEEESQGWENGKKNNEDLDDEDEDEVIEDNDEEDTSKEPEVFLDKDDVERLTKNRKETEERLKIIGGKKKSNFKDIVKDGMEKSIANSASEDDDLLDDDEKEVVEKAKEVSGKLNLKVSVDEKPEEEKKKNVKMSPIEKNIVKNVIKNKANKVAKEEHDDLADFLLREHGTKEEGVKAEDWKFEKEAEQIVKEEENKEIIEENDSQNKIKPKLSFLMSDAGNAYIGRKKSIMKSYGEQAGLHIGRIAEDEMNKTPVYLDGLNPHVVFVCGARGSGKSYVLGVLAEELALKNKNIGIVVVDPIGVFWSMKHPNRDEKEIAILAEWDMLPKGLNNVKVFIPIGMKSSVPKSTYDATFSVQPSLLTAEDWCLTFGMDRFSPTGLLLDKVLEKVRIGYTTKGENPKQIRGKEQTYSIDDMIYCLDNDFDLNDRDKGYKQESIRAIVSRFDAAKSWGIFDESGTPLSMLSRAGQMTILDTSFLDDTVGALVIGIISRRLLSARKLSTRREAAGKFDEGKDEDLIEINVPPTWLFIDEAHTLIPGGNAKTPASKAIVEYVKQGRRPGLSLVFATQQPSAIDSRVLSQLDIMMVHKLVFDDDVKAIQKRTPTIIPGPYKKSNFIKTLPVGTALTGDGQETSSRAFVMNIRPRMSQHEGRDAEIIEVKHDLGKEQVEELALKIILNKLKKDPSLKIDALQQILETLSDTYKQQLTMERILELLKQKNIDFDDERVYAPGVLKEIEAEKVSDEQEISEESVVDENGEEINSEKIDGKNSVDEETAEQEFEAGVELTALQSTIDETSARKLLVNYRLRKKLGLFGDEEILDRLSLKYGVLYRMRFNYFSQKDAYQVGEAYINSLTKEFIHDRGGQLVESMGLSLLADLNESEVLAVKLLQRKIELKELAEKLGMEEGNAKRVLEKLAKKDLIKVEQINENIFYSMKKKFDLPPNPLHAIMPSVGRRPIIEVESMPIIAPEINEKEAAELLKKLWHNVTIREITQLFLPVWEGILKRKTGEERVVRIDAINGKKLD